MEDGMNSREMDELAAPTKDTMSSSSPSPTQRRRPRMPLLNGVYICPEVDCLFASGTYQTAVMHWVRVHSGDSAPRPKYARVDETDEGSKYQCPDCEHATGGCGNLHYHWITKHKFPLATDGTGQSGTTRKRAAPMDEGEKCEFPCEKCAFQAETLTRLKCHNLFCHHRDAMLVIDRPSHSDAHPLSTLLPLLDRPPIHRNVVDRLYYCCDCSHTAVHYRTSFCHWLHTHSKVKVAMPHFGEGEEEKCTVCGHQPAAGPDRSRRLGYHWLLCHKFPLVNAKGNNVATPTASCDTV